MPLNESFIRRTFSRGRFLFALGGVAFMTGCQYNADLGTLDGQALGEAAAVVYGYSTNGDLMVVFSDQTDLCGRLAHATPPGGSFWVVSIWDGSPTRQSAAFASVGTGDGSLEYGAALREIEVRDMRVGSRWEEYERSAKPTLGIRGKVEIKYETGEDVSTRFEAQYCETGLFNGME